MYSYKRSLRVFLTAAMVASTAVIVAGQGNGQVGTCAQNLEGCFSALNNTATPPSSCCTPLKDAVINQKACLCNLYKNPALLKSFGVNVTQAMNLPTRCKIHTDSDANNFCKGVAPSGSPSSSSTPGASSSGTGSNSAAIITGTAFVSSLLMFVTYVVVY